MIANYDNFPANITWHVELHKYKSGEDKGDDKKLFNKLKIEGVNNTRKEYGKDVRQKGKWEKRGYYTMATERRWALKNSLTYLISYPANPLISLAYILPQE